MELGGGDLHIALPPPCSFANSFSPAAFHQCVISGDPHYRTFDNFVHHFQGRCTYTLTRTLGRVPQGLEPLSVAGRNHRRSSLHRISFLREVYVEVLGFRVTLMQGRKMAVSSQEICLRDDAPGRWVALGRMVLLSSSSWFLGSWMASAP